MIKPDTAYKEAYWFKCLLTFVQIQPFLHNNIKCVKTSKQQWIIYAYLVNLFYQLNLSWQLH